MAELPPSTFRILVREFSSRPATSRVVFKELSGVSDRPIVIRMPTTSRPQQRYDHRLRDLVRRTGDLTLATDLGVPRSTARGWLRATPKVVVTLDQTDLTEPELRQEILKLQGRVEKLAALLRLALALLQASEFRLSAERLPDGPAKRRILGGSGSRAPVPPLARGSPVPGSVAESLSGVAPTAHRVDARRCALGTLE
jgi:hypothetical protein